MQVEAAIHVDLADSPSILGHLLGIWKEVGEHKHMRRVESLLNSLVLGAEQESILELLNHAVVDELFGVSDVVEDHDGLPVKGVSDVDGLAPVAVERSMSINEVTPKEGFSAVPDWIKPPVNSPRIDRVGHDLESSCLPVTRHELEELGNLGLSVTRHGLVYEARVPRKHGGVVVHDLVAGRSLENVLEAVEDIVALASMENGQLAAGPWASQAGFLLAVIRRLRRTAATNGEMGAWQPLREAGKALLPSELDVAL